MIRNAIVFYDYETTGLNPMTCQPIQLAAVKINMRDLKVEKNTLFVSLIKPLSEEESVKAGLEPLSDKILEITHKTRAELEAAPDLKTVWKSFVKYMESHNPTGKDWDAPCAGGHNILRYDNIITDRLCRQFGQYNEGKGYNKLFHPRDSWDTMEAGKWWWHNENLTNRGSLSMDSMRELFGISKEFAHDAKVDVLQGAHLLVSFLALYRNLAPQIKWKDTFSDGRLDFSAE